MGEIIKKVVGDVDSDPRYEEFTVEWNEIGHAHIHHGNVRLDLDVDDYNRFYDAMMTGYTRLKEIHGW